MTACMIDVAKRNGGGGKTVLCFIKKILHTALGAALLRLSDKQRYILLTGLQYPIPIFCPLWSEQ